MRVAIFSDVHGNLAALEAVMAALEREGPLDATVFAGDAVLYGPSPADVVERLQQAGFIALRGNCDGVIAGQVEQILPPDPDVAAALAAHKHWTVARLSAEQIQWLGRLPVEHRISPPGAAGARDDLLIVHATPRDFNDDARFCRPDLPADEAREVFGRAGAGTVVFGHFHGHFISAYGDLTLVNASSASLTPDLVPAAAYTIATWHGGHWSFEQRRAAYDPEPEKRRARERDFPFFPWFEQLTAK